MLNFILISLLTYEVCNLHKRVEKNSKIVGNIKIDDLDENFWTE